MKNKIVILSLILTTSLSFASDEDEIIKKIRSIINEKGVDYYINAMVDYSQKEYPLKMDNLDTITGVYYLKTTNALTYNHLLASDWKTQISNKTGIGVDSIEKYLPGLMQSQAIARACSVTLNKLYFEHGVKLVGLYADNTGAIVFSTTVIGSDCGI